MYTYANTFLTALDNIVFHLVCYLSEIEREILTYVSTLHTSGSVAGGLREGRLKGEEMKSIATNMRSTKSHRMQNLRLLRQRKGLSLGQLADLSGLRRDTISHLETGREEPQPYHVRILARALGVATLDLIY